MIGNHTCKRTDTASYMAVIQSCQIRVKIASKYAVFHFCKKYVKYVQCTYIHTYIHTYTYIYTYVKYVGVFDSHNFLTLLNTSEIRSYFVEKYGENGTFSDLHEIKIGILHYFLTLITMQTVSSRSDIWLTTNSS